VAERHRDAEGYFFALDARSGALLWKATVGGVVASGPMTYAVGGSQYAVAAGSSLFTCALRQQGCCVFVTDPRPME
jgi:glucose dehydrogenase